MSGIGTDVGIQNAPEFLGVGLNPQEVLDAASPPRQLHPDEGRGAGDLK
jgi:hypothetical protein